MQDNGDYNNTYPANPVYYINLVPVIADGLLRIEITNNYQLDLSIGNLYQILGTNQAILTTTTTGPNPVDITRGVDSWSVHCSLTGGSYDNGIASDTLYGFKVPMPAVSQRCLFYPTARSFLGPFPIFIEPIDRDELLDLVVSQLIVVVHSFDIMDGVPGIDACKAHFPLILTRQNDWRTVIDCNVVTCPCS